MADTADNTDHPLENKEDLSELSDQPDTPVKKKDVKIFKIIVIGDSNVGKSCLACRFCDGRFPTRVEATIGVDFKEKVIEIEGDVLKLQLWDTAGQERFRKSMVPHYYRNVHAVVYVYDMTKRRTFESLAGWLTEYSRHNLKDDKVPRILVGNKCDEPDLVKVTTNEAQRFADMNNMPLFETSALDDNKADHVDSIFMTIAHRLRVSKPMMGSNYTGVRLETPQYRPQTIYHPIGLERKKDCAC